MLVAPQDEGLLVHGCVAVDSGTVGAAAAVTSTIPDLETLLSGLPFGREPRIGVLVVAYNAASTLATTLERIPVAFRHRICEVLVCDDASDDQTYLVGLGYRDSHTDLPITVIRHETNLGYGGNQKAGYRLAAELDLDIVVLLHADGQYAPELLPDIVAPLERGECDAVFGSRMMVKGGPRAGGMPLYKYIGNRLLTSMENRALGTKLSEFHSGYRAYTVRALSGLDLTATSDGFDFDTQIIIALHSGGKRIIEIPIPTFYGDEICYVNGLSYASKVLKDVTSYRLARSRFTRRSVGRSGPDYGPKECESSSRTALSSNWSRSRRRLMFSTSILVEAFWQGICGSEGMTSLISDSSDDSETARRDGVVLRANLDLGLPAGRTGHRAGRAARQHHLPVQHCRFVIGGG